MNVATPSAPTETGSRRTVVLSAVIPEWQAAALDVLAKRDAGTRSSALRSVLARGLLNELRERDEQ